MPTGGSAAASVLDEALTWLDTGLDAAQARQLINNGVPTAQHMLQLEHDSDLSRFVLVHLLGVVPREEMDVWLEVICMSVQTRWSRSTYGDWWKLA